ncbi:MAG: lytic transglycosylase domain-containing protein [Actinomycetota bacterium]|nr:lytic transglycosylase domain-containing protein [Actinomycetota bacterium]
MTRLLALVALVAVAAGGVLALEPGWYLRLRYPLEHEQIVLGHARNYQLEPALLAAVIYEESRFHADARSGQGAVGLMQLLPETAEGIAERTGGSRFEVSDLLDPEINVRYGSWYLRHLIRKYGDVRTALAAYNGGQGNVDRGVQFEETRQYVEKVLETRDAYARAYPQLDG